ncbi:hypothetical protein ERICIV_02492 [Paenibacillus larvae subsp. larvae]|uniref:Uncharacterized protein n=1 Tax=Paenibacillus larvae subsp. larvae TaxID=147375 RepID=A0A2L1UEW2_9BACL|nr:hypothetical protein ERICIII_02503 [Paenibacillus larvae subsp. larvae]AVF31398.1 hypothetical protein ERICIV_02492 [Paenibacillus larvae subsp. larvae]
MSSLLIRPGCVLVFVEGFVQDSVAVSAADFVVVFSDVSTGAFSDVFTIVSKIVFTAVPAASNFLPKSRLLKVKDAGKPLMSSDSGAYQE